MLLMEDYPHDRVLGDKFINKSTWEIYKHGVVEVCVRARQPWANVFVDLYTWDLNSKICTEMYTA